MESWKNALKILLPILAVAILIGAYFYFKAEEQNSDQSSSGAENSTDVLKTQEQIMEENERKATADENFVPKPEEISNAKITPSNVDALDIEPNPSEINNLSAPK